MTIEEAQASKEAMDKFVEENMGLVRASIKKIGLNSFDDDYLQEGAIGLIKAVKYFKPEYGNEFSTYAVPMIQGEIMRYRRNFETDTLTGAHTSRSIKDIYFKALRLNHKSDEEICKELEISQKDLDNAMNCMRPSTSLDAPIYDDCGDERGLVIQDMIGSDEEDFTEAIYDNLIIDQLYDALDEKQTEVLYYHLRGLTQPQVAAETGVSQAQVSRILRKIIEKGKRILEKGGGSTVKITEEQLLNECREHGTNIEAMQYIAAKYGMTLGSIKHKVYTKGIVKKLKAEKVEKPVSQVVEDAAREIFKNAYTPPKAEPVLEIPPISNYIAKPEQTKKPSILKVMTWGGKECSYAFENGKLVIETKEGTIQIDDYKTMLLEIQELIDNREAV